MPLPSHPSPQIFEFADMYTLGVSLEEYVSFLWKLFWRIASGTPPELCFWKPDAKILYAPIDSIIAFRSSGADAGMNT